MMLRDTEAYKTVIEMRIERPLSADELAAVEADVRKKIEQFNATFVRS